MSTLPPSQQAADATPPLAGNSGPQGNDAAAVTIARPRRPRHPLISVAVILLSGYLLISVRDDLRYLAQDATPVDLGALPQALTHPQLRPHRFVTLEGAPDRRHAMLIEGRLRGFDSVYLLLQSNGRIYVRERRAARASDSTVSGKHTGRLMPLSALPYDDKLKAYIGATLRREHVFSPAAFFPALVSQTSPAPLPRVDEDGQAVTLSPHGEVWIDVRYPDEWIVELPKAAYSTAEAQAQLTALALPHAVDDAPSDVFWRLIVLASDDQARPLAQALRTPTSHARLMPRQQTILTTLQNLSLVDGQLLVTDDAAPALSRYQPRPDALSELARTEIHPPQIPAEVILRISTSVPYILPDDALVIFSGEQPRDAWPYLALALLLAGFIALNTALLWHHRRRSQ